MAKKIAIIIERTNVALGGAERSIFELRSALLALGTDIDIIAANGQSNAKNVHILFDGDINSRTSPAQFEAAIKDFLGRNHYDIIHSVLPFSFADIYQPRGGSYRESIIQNAASYENRFIELYKNTTSWLNFQRAAILRREKELCHSANHTIIAALSNYVGDQFRNHYNMSDNRLNVIANGVKTDRAIDHKESEKLHSQIMYQLDIREGQRPIFFLMAANNFRLKGLSPLIRAISQSGNKLSNCFFLIAGRGKSGHYRHLIKKHNISNKILFLGSVRHIQNLLSIVDVSVLPTFYDPSSRFVLESLAGDTPVITTKFNGASDMFTDKRHGYIIDQPQDTSALSEALCHFGNRTNISQAKEAIISDHLADNISINRVAKEIDTLYDSIITSRKK